ncbi:MAG: biopolymer transporter ExbD, partial [Treponema sp.]|nr:biopolymer transporter ExbD [Treponema sp.]
MMNLEFLKHNEEELSINITSMIDVIFILLIFFMVSTQRQCVARQQEPRRLHRDECR